MNEAEILTGRADAAMDALARVRNQIAHVIFGQDDAIELVLTGILAGGHVLLVGAPGLAKTQLVEAMAHTLGTDWARIQFTPDLMPTDILGSEILDENGRRGRSFRFVRGPVFTSLLMADEINRASPRTQSALLQAMQEKHVTIAGKRRDLPLPFHVLATQNPLEQEGTYPLPEAQLDRFLLKIDITYPDIEAEHRIMVETTGPQRRETPNVLTPGELMDIQALIRSIPVPRRVIDAIVDLVRSARPGQSRDLDQKIAWGPSPRAGQALMLSARARALQRGRLVPSLDDVQALANAALGHRMALAYSPDAGKDALDQMVADLTRRACGPKVT